MFRFSFSNVTFGVFQLFANLPNLIHFYTMQSDIVSSVSNFKQSCASIVEKSSFFRKNENVHNIVFYNKGRFSETVSWSSATQSIFFTSTAQFAVIVWCENCIPVGVLKSFQINLSIFPTWKREYKIYEIYFFYHA